MNGSESERNARITRIVQTYQSSLLRLAFAYVKNTQDAEDIAQDVFVAFFRASPAFSSAEHEKAYLLRAAINRCKNHFKAAWIKNRRPLPETFSETPYDEASDSPVLSCVLTLEEKYRMPIHLHYYEGYSIAEIAGILGEKPATIGTRLSRGREALKAIIGGIENV